MAVLLAGFYFFGVPEVIFLVFACGLLCCLLVVVFGVCGLVFCRGARVAVARPTRIPRTHRTTHTHNKHTHTQNKNVTGGCGVICLIWGALSFACRRLFFFRVFVWFLLCFWRFRRDTHTTHTHTQNKNVTGDRPTK